METGLCLPSQKLACSSLKEVPEIGPEFIGFNGAENCGHAKNPFVSLPWPAAKVCGIGDNEGIGGTLPY